MEGKGLVYGCGDSMNQAQKRKISSHEQGLDSNFASAPSNYFLGSRTMVSFGALDGMKRSGNLLFGSFDQEESGDEYFDEYYNQPEKKKRLTVDQVQFLEKSFELENKLEPERKIQLAKELGLQPRQIAVWFQNRRARWKTKNLETEYETLHASYKSLETGYDNLLKENEKLKAEVLHLKGNGLDGDFVKANTELHENVVPLSETTPKHNDILGNEESTMQAVACKYEEQSSDKSDVTNTSSPHFTDGMRSSNLESGESSLVFEPHEAELLQAEENNLNEEELFLQSYIFLKMEDTCSYLPASSCSYGFPVEDHSFGFWSC